MKNNYLVDIGLNLTNSSFNKDLTEVLERAYQANVLQMLITGTSEKESLEAFQLCQKYDTTGQHLFSTAGVHPHHAKDWHSGLLATLKNLLAESTTKAVGECGLDFNRDFSPRAVQEKVFEEQLALAEELDLPVFMHERDADDHFIGILKNHRDALKNGIVHCFTGDKKTLYQYLDMDLHIGITGWICDERRGSHLQTLIKDIPEGRLMLETDAPYLLPRTLAVKPKNRRNEPAFLLEVVSLVAQCRNESVEHLTEHTTKCAREFFDLPCLEV